jgi:hypothetical protein
MMLSLIRHTGSGMMLSLIRYTGSGIQLSTSKVSSELVYYFH